MPKSCTRFAGQVGSGSIGARRRKAKAFSSRWRSTAYSRFWRRRGITLTSCSSGISKLTKRSGITHVEVDEIAEVHPLGYSRRKRAKYGSRSNVLRGNSLRMGTGNFLRPNRELSRGIMVFFSLIGESAILGGPAGHLP